MPRGESRARRSRLQTGLGLGAADRGQRRHRVACEEVEDEAVADGWLLDEQAVRGAGDDRELPVWEVAIQRDRVLERNFVVVAEHHERASLDSIQFGRRERGLCRVHLGEFLDDDGIVAGSVRRDLGIETLKKLGRIGRLVEDSGAHPS